MITLQVTRANDMFLSDLPTYTGDQKHFLDWLLKLRRLPSLLDDPNET